MKIRTSLIILQFALLAFSGAASAQEKTPVEWVAQLGADNLKDRDTASAALLSLGVKARDAVRGALDSKDAEVQARARELWKTLRWDVIPGAEKDTAVLMAGISAALEKEKQNAAAETMAAAQGWGRMHLRPTTLKFGPPPADDEGNETLCNAEWTDFVKQHGADSLHLLAEFRAERAPAKNYRAGVLALLDEAPPGDIIRVLNADPAARDSLAAPFNVCGHHRLSDDKSDAAYVRVLAALGPCQRAYEFGRDSFFDYAGDGRPVLIAACADVVKQGGLYDAVEAAAFKAVAETDPGKLYPADIFYTKIMIALGKKDRIGPLLDAVRKAMPAGWVPSSLIGDLLDAGLPGVALSMLRDAKDPDDLYTRSHVNSLLHDDAAAQADWKATLAAIEASTDKKGAYYSLADSMEDYDDPRAEEYFRKVLAMPVEKDDNYETNVWLKLSEIAENHQHYAEAADDYEKMMKSFAKNGGVIIFTTPDGKDGTYDDTDLQKKLDSLRKLAAEAQKIPSK